jgi:predicted amidohydrolase
VVCFPEYFLQGYLLDEPAAHAHSLELDSEFDEVLKRFQTYGTTAILGLIERDGNELYNTAAANLARLAALGLRSTPPGWTVTA